MNIIIFFLLFNCYLNNKIKDIITENNNLTNSQNKTYPIFKSNRRKINKKNAILGIIQNYSLIIILPFFKSLIRANLTNCDVIMFVRHVSQDLITYLKDIKVFVFKIPKKYRKVSVINLRWKMYLDFLRKRKEEYNLVFSVDIRDTIFQKDIFKYYENFSEPFLGVSIEDGTLNEKINKNWLINFIGEEIHKVIQNNRIICVGSIWGTLDKFLEFSIIFWENLISNTHAVEQGIGNYLFYYKKIFQDCLIKSDNYGPVMTIGLTERNNIILDNQDNILNFGGEIAAVIHQYDKKCDILIKIYKKFCPEALKFFKSMKDKLDKPNIIIYRCFEIINKFNKTNRLNSIIYIKNYYKNIISLLIYIQIFIIVFQLKKRN